MGGLWRSSNGASGLRFGQAQVHAQRGEIDLSRTSRRMLQGGDSSGSGISADTIAIVLSMLVGAAGYVVQARTARRAERAQEQQAHELHTAEQARQREHQMMTAQIERTDQALDQCCRPVLNDLGAMTLARLSMLQKLVGSLEASHPDVVKQMLSIADGVLSKLNPDSTVTSTSSGRLLWKPNSAAKLTRAMVDYQLTAPTGAACLVGTHDTFLSFSEPFCFEMPTAVLDIINFEPTGEIAETYRGYARHTVMPLLLRVAETLRKHAAYVELPPKDWLATAFPEMTWRTFSNAFFVQQWTSYVLSFEHVLSEWSVGNFKSCRPTDAAPGMGLFQTLKWSQEQAEGRQAELIGMTSKADLSSSNSLFRAKS
eukprot:SAG31_NODE_5828_length_2306_cov_1.451744_2_plen_370_part_00